ncbi:MAG: hypothetical protein KA735_14445 [Burkholderiaceae bacterium]|nr:hypothetical protein [Burkholderiaceae bacterium]
MRIFTVLFLSAMLLGCSPDYNWRTVTLGSGEVSAYFPDKPLAQQRSLDFADQKLVFSLTSATVADAVFAVGYATLPPALRDDAVARQALMAAAIRSLYQNMGQAAPDDLPISGEHFQVDGQVPSGPVRLRATVWLTQDALVEGLVSASKSDFPSDQTDEFFRSLKVTTN